MSSAQPLYPRAGEVQRFRLPSMARAVLGRALLAVLVSGCGRLGYDLLPLEGDVGGSDGGPAGAAGDGGMSGGSGGAIDGGATAGGGGSGGQAGAGESGAGGAGASIPGDAGGLEPS